jgi:hypothetical protein
VKDAVQYGSLRQRPTKTNGMGVGPDRRIREACIFGCPGRRSIADMIAGPGGGKLQVVRGRGVS